MNRLTNILVPVDFSEASKEAIHYGSRLALAFHARLVTAHIVPFAGFTYAFPGDTSALEKQVLDEAERRLPEEIPASYRARLNTLPIVRSGDVRDELLSIVESEKIDLVVMGTHGRRAWERLFLGSTTESMLRKIPVPILTISQRSEEANSPFEVPFRRIVYATDLSETAAIGFRYCVDLVRTLGAQLTLLHVLDTRETFAFESDPEIRANLEARLHQMIKKEDGVGLPLRVEIGHGIPYRRVLNFAEESSADLLVINLQSKALLEHERALLGSTAERIIRCSRIPVLSIPSATAGNALRASNVDSEASLEMRETRIA